MGTSRETLILWGKSMKSKVLILAAAVATCACSGPQLTKEAQAIRTIENADDCRFIATETFTGLPKTVHDYIRQQVDKSGGNAYKILSANAHSAAFANDTQRITYEIYDCPNR